MKRCFSKAGVASVVTIGDSNAQRYFSTLFEDMKSFSRECRMIRIEQMKGSGSHPDKAYFTRGRHHRDVYEKILVSHSRYCGGCGAIEVECWWRKWSIDGQTDGDDLSRTSVEHLPATMILPTSLRILIPAHRNNLNISISKYFAQSSIEFFFKYYLDGRYPDVLIVFLPFNHAKFINMERIRIDIETFHALLKMYIPRSTKVFYMPSFAEFEHSRKGDFWKDKRVDGMLAWQRIDILNGVLYDVIKGDLFNASSGIYSFFDLLDMSKDRGRWSKDGVHMEALWYSKIIRTFWEVFCNSVLSNDF